MYQRYEDISIFIDYNFTNFARLLLLVTEKCQKVYKLDSVDTNYFTLEFCYSKCTFSGRTTKNVHYSGNTFNKICTRNRSFYPKE